VSKKKADFQRPQAAVLAERRRFVQVVAGPRQVGKSTLVQRAIESTPGVEYRF
jgi:predicted AAA+ superfamily ATPase